MGGLRGLTVYPGYFGEEPQLAVQVKELKKNPNFTQVQQVFVQIVQRGTLLH